MIVDNNSSDETAWVADNFKNQIKDLRYAFKPEPGLSNARYRGLKVAKGVYVGYNNDDCILLTGWIETALKVFREIEPFVSGKPYTIWYEKPKPKWVGDSFGTITHDDSLKYLERE